MKIITILLLMISTQAQALTAMDVLTAGVYTVEQCNQIANISKRTIKAAIIGVPIAEVIDKFADRPDRLAILEDVQAKSGLLDGQTTHGITGDTSNLVPSPRSQQLNQLGDDAQISRIQASSEGTQQMNRLRPSSTQNLTVKAGPQTVSDVIVTSLADNAPSKIRAIYKTVGQIKTKYGQVRPQDRVRLNNRIEQLLLECVQTGTFGMLKYSNEGYYD